MEEPRHPCSGCFVCRDLPPGSCAASISRRRGGGRSMFRASQATLEVRKHPHRLGGRPRPGARRRQVRLAETVFETKRTRSLEEGDVTARTLGAVAIAHQHQIARSSTCIGEGTEGKINLVMRSLPWSGRATTPQQHGHLRYGRRVKRILSCPAEGGAKFSHCAP